MTLDSAALFALGSGLVGSVAGCAVFIRVYVWAKAIIR